MTTPTGDAKVWKRVGFTCAIFMLIGLLAWFAMRRNETEAERRARHLLGTLHRQSTGGIHFSDLSDELRSLPDPAGSVFRSILGSPDDRYDAPEALKELGVAAWRPLTNALVTEPEEHVRTSVIDVLEELEDDRVTDVLREALKRESSKDVRASLLSTLHRLGVAEAEGWIFDALESGPLTDAPRQLLAVAADSRSERAKALVLRALESDVTAMLVAGSLDKQEVSTNRVLQTLLLARLRTTTDDSLRRDCLDKLAGSAHPDVLAEAERVARDAKKPIARREALAFITAAPHDTALRILKSLGQSDSSATRKDAVERLADFQDPEATSTLLERLRGDEAPDVRAAAARGLASAARSAKSEEIAAALMDILSRESSETVRVALVKALGNFRQPTATEALRSIVTKRGNSAIRVAAIEGLLRQPGPGSLEQLLELATEPGFGDVPKAKLLDHIAARREAKHRHHFIEAIEQQGSEELVAAGLRGLGALGPDEARRARVSELARTSDDATVRAEAIQALAGLRTPETATALMEILRREKEDEPRATAARALGHFNDPETVKALASCLGSKSPEDVRATAAESLARIGDAAALKVLFDDYENSPANRPKLLEVLGRFRDPKVRILATNAIASGNRSAMHAAMRILPDVDDAGAAAVLSRLLRTAKTAATREAAAEALARVSDPDADNALLSALNDPAASVQAAAASSLGERRCRRAESALVALLKSPAADVQFAAAFALVALGATNVVPDLEHFAGSAAGRERFASASARAFLGSESGMAILARTLEPPGESDWQTFTAILSLLKLGTPEARRALETTLPDPQFFPMHTAGLKGGTTAALLMMLEQPPDLKEGWRYGNHHYLALRAFTYLPDPAALPAIERFVDDADAHLRHAARNAQRRAKSSRQ